MILFDQFYLPLQVAFPIQKMALFFPNFVYIFPNMSHNMTKPTKCVCTQRRLTSAWASTQSDQSSLCAQWVAKDPRFLHADSQDSDQIGRMHTCEPSRIIREPPGHAAQLPHLPDVKIKTKKKKNFFFFFFPDHHFCAYVW